MLFSVKVASAPRRQLTEADREFAKDCILKVMNGLKFTISTREPILFGAAPSSCEALPSTKRARVAAAGLTDSRRPAALLTTDTGCTIQALKYLLKILSCDWFADEEEEGARMLLGILLAVMSTPWAAFYLDFDPTKPVYRNVRNCVYSALRTEFKEALCEREPELPLAKELAKEVCNNYGPCKTPLQVLFRTRMMELLDLCMEKITLRLQATRSAWKGHTVRLAETCVYTVTIPEGELPRFTISPKWLPIDILPPAGIRNPKVHSTPYGPRSDERDMVRDLKPTPPGLHAAVLNALKYELTMLAVDKDPALCIELTTVKVETVVDLVRGTLPVE
jgi:hypothetical protein